MSFLQIQDLSYTYPNSGIKAVDGLDLEAEKGELIALIGPNAAGKSTFALLLKGLLRPDAGAIRYGGRDRAGQGPDPGIGILFSNPENQLVTSIVQEDVAFGLEVLGEPSLVIQNRVRATLERLGIDHLRERMPHLLSGGEQQMAALAGVLVLDPDILVLDEPTTYLDPESRASVWSRLRDLAGEGKVVILITHNMKEAALADRVVLLDGGRVAVEGAPEGVFGRPDLASRYGIYPPFLLDLVLRMRSRGMEAGWPQEPESVARALREVFEAYRRGSHEGDLKEKGAAAGDPALELEGVRFTYQTGSRGTRAVLAGVDLSVEKGTVALVCGANGSGKSTLLQISNGLLSPDVGCVRVGGQELGRLRRRKGGIARSVALLFQNPERQVFSPTVFEDIAFGPRNIGVRRDMVEERVNRAARWAGLPPEIMDRPVHTLSGGQLRRTAVAGVLAMETDVLVLDEPTDGLDPGGAREFYSAVRRYCDDTGTTVVMATHEVPEQIAVMDHLCHLAQGRILSSGPPAAVLEGSRRTVPTRYLPDHMVVAEALAGAGARLLHDLSDPENFWEILR